MILVKDGDDILITSESRERSCGYDFCADLCFLFLSTIICRPPKYDGPGNLILLEWWYLDDHFKCLDLLWIRPYGLQVPEWSPTQEMSTGLSIYKHRETSATFVCVDLSFFAFLEYRGSQECITLVKFNSTLWEDYELDIPESCIFPYWRNNKPANGNTQQTTHCSGKKTCKLFKIHKTQHGLLAKYLANWYAINKVCSTTLISNLVSTAIKLLRLKFLRFHTKTRNRQDWSNKNSCVEIDL